MIKFGVVELVHHLEWILPVVELVHHLEWILPVVELVHHLEWILPVVELVHHLEWILPARCALTHTAADQFYFAYSIRFNLYFNKNEVDE